MFFRYRFGGGLGVFVVLLLVVECDMLLGFGLGGLLERRITLVGVLLMCLGWVWVGCYVCLGLLGLGVIFC